MFTGVSKIGRNFWAIISTKLVNGKISRYGGFSTEEEALFVYIAKKKEYIRKVAQKYYNDNKIVKKAYEALMVYNIKITDK